MVEFPRAEGALDRLHWYCAECDKLVHEAPWKLERIDRDLKKIMEDFWGGPEADRTCKHCGAVVERAERVFTGAGCPGSGHSTPVGRPTRGE